MTDYADHLQPSGSPVSVSIPCKLVRATINGEERMLWQPIDTDRLHPVLEAALGM